ncbi:hypothetical protein AVEN_124462-1, partial [Araneus ventricosus]
AIFGRNTSQEIPAKSRHPTMRTHLCADRGKEERAESHYPINVCPSLQIVDLAWDFVRVMWPRLRSAIVPA